MIRNRTEHPEYEPGTTLRRIGARAREDERPRARCRCAFFQ